MRMNQSKIKALASELSKDLKTPEDLSELSAELTKITVEAALKAEMESHKVIYTTNAIESLNSVIRKSVKTRKLFPSDGI